MCPDSIWYDIGIKTWNLGVIVIYQPDTEGQGLVEYAIILMLMALAVLLMVTLFGTTLASTYSMIVSSWPSV